MSASRIIELAAAVLLLCAALWLYRRREPDGYGSQSAVLLLAVSLIVGIHAIGGLDYRPSPNELDMARAQ